MSHALCADCGVDTIPDEPDFDCEWYTVHDHIWAQVGLGRGFLCIGCLEARIGRRLQPEDFPDVPVNDPQRYKLTSSDRLLDRLGWVRVIERDWSLLADEELIQLWHDSGVAAGSATPGVALPHYVQEKIDGRIACEEELKARGFILNVDHWMNTEPK